MRNLSAKRFVYDMQMGFVISYSGAEVLHSYQLITTQSLPNVDFQSACKSYQVRGGNSV